GRWPGAIGWRSAPTATPRAWRTRSRPCTSMPGPMGTTRPRWRAASPLAMRWWPSASATAWRCRRWAARRSWPTCAWWSRTVGCGTCWWEAAWWFGTGCSPAPISGRSAARPRPRRSGCGLAWRPWPDRGGRLSARRRAHVVVAGREHGRAHQVHQVEEGQVDLALDAAGGAAARVGGVEPEIEARALEAGRGAAARRGNRGLEALAVEAPQHRAHRALLLHVEAVVIREFLPVGAAAEEARLDHVGPAVLGAEHVTVAALVAEVGEVGDLVLLDHRDRLGRLGHHARTVGPQLEHRDLARGQH